MLWEIRRESRNESVLLPMSMWTQPGAKMGPTIALVFFGWWGFNVLGYFLPLFFQEVQLLSPLQTAVRLVPMGISVSPLISCSILHPTKILQGLLTNIVTGYVVALVPGQILVLSGLLPSVVRKAIYKQRDMRSYPIDLEYCVRTY